MEAPLGVLGNINFFGNMGKKENKSGNTETMASFRDSQGKFCWEQGNMDLPWEVLSMSWQLTQGLMSLMSQQALWASEQLDIITVNSEVVIRLTKNSGLNFQNFHVSKEWCFSPGYTSKNSGFVGPLFFVTPIWFQVNWQSCSPKVT